METSGFGQGTILHIAMLLITLTPFRILGHSKQFINIALYLQSVSPNPEKISLNYICLQVHNCISGMLI